MLRRLAVMHRDAGSPAIDNHKELELGQFFMWPFMSLWAGEYRKLSVLAFANLCDSFGKTFATFPQNLLKNIFFALPFKDLCVILQAKA